MLKISFGNQNIDNNNAIAFIINDQLKIESNLLTTEKNYQLLLSKLIKVEKNLQLEDGYYKILTTINEGNELRYLIFIALGTESSVSEVRIEEIGGRIYSLAAACNIDSLTIRVPHKINYIKSEKIAALLASGALLASYRFDKYQTMQKNENNTLSKVDIILKGNYEDAIKFYEEQKSLALGVFFARDCINESPNVLYPETYAKIILEKLTPLGIEVDILGQKEMYNLGMEALLAVGQGSSKQSKLVVIKYRGLNDNSNPLCLVGKGVTFDSGGISLKPAYGMGDMKYDMSGSAAVIGSIKALALRKAKVNIVGVVGLVENMPGGNSQKPGDIVRTMSGKTIEVLNTDAEGRLVLCECINYLQQNFDPICIVDIATLTGAISIALGNTYAGCYSNDDELANRLIKSSLEVNEKLWRMPLHSDYSEMLKSSIADISNIGSEKGLAGSCTAAEFISFFIKSGIKWAHLDIAGVAWDKKGKNPISTRGGVGFGVRLLSKFIKDYYELR